jgi:asparaginyl-tRNA synthetase
MHLEAELARTPTRPFLRLSYAEAIQWLNDHGIQRPAAVEDADSGKEGAAEVMENHVLGDDIAEAAERQMTDIIGRPVFLYGFPAALKAFYMKKMIGAGGASEVYTESCDLLMPNVGEVVGVSFYLLTYIWMV